MLNSQYFKKIHQDSNDSFTYTCYQPLHNPICLYSKVTGDPLASIHLMSNHDSKTLIGKAPASCKDLCDFQGFVEKDSDEFYFVLTNFTKEDLVMNIVKTNQDRKMLGQLNEVNCIPSMRSVKIEADKSTGRSLILTMARSDQTDKQITVGELPSLTGKEREDKGTFYSITCIPPSSNKEPFKETLWTCVDMMIIKSDPPKVAVDGFEYSDMLSGAPLSGTNFFGYNLRNTNLQLRSAPPNPQVSVSPWNDQNAVNISSQGYKRRSQAVGRPRPKKGAQSSSRNFFGASLPSLPSQPSRSRPPLVYDKMALEMDDSESDEDMGFDLFDDGPVTSTRSRESIFRDAVATQVKAGREVKVWSKRVEMTLAYECTTDPIVLLLSISSQLTFLEKEVSNDALVEEAKEILAKKLADSLAEISKDLKTYKEDNCCLCMDSDPDTVLYTCGHQCIHMECLAEDLNKCPLCRTRISAKLDARQIETCKDAVKDVKDENRRQLITGV